MQTAISRPLYSGQVWVKNILIVAGGALLMALAGPLSIKLPFTPIPLSLAPHMALLLGAMIGKERAFFAVVAYLVQGACGLPVFAGGNSGILYLLGPTGGYLLGYVMAAYTTGALVERLSKSSFAQTFLALFAGNALIYFFGVAHLSLFCGWEKALYLGMLPFLPGDLLKTVLICRLCKRV